MSFSILPRSARTKVVALALLATTTALLAGCGGSDSTSPNPPPPPPPPADVWSSIAQRSWSIPSITEAYKCHVEQVSGDKYYTGFRLASPPAAQTEIYVLMRPAVTHTGDYDCSQGDIDGGELIYAAGGGTTQLEFAGGKGVHVASGAYLMLIVHISDTTATNMTATTTVEARIATAKDVTTPIDMFLVGRLHFFIPADGTPTLWNGSCAFADESHMVAAIPLMRALGTHVALTITVSNVNQSLIDASFDTHHLLYTSFTPALDVPAGARINTGCTFVNNTGSIVNDGESASDEICYAGVYRYPPKPPTFDSPLECMLGLEI